MNITQITVGWSETCSLPEYNNVKPSVSLTADIAPGEDPQATVNILLAECKRICREQVDEALESCGRQPRHYTGPRYSLITNRPSKLLAVVPYDFDWAPYMLLGWQSWYTGLQPGVSHAGVLRWAMRCCPAGFTVIDPEPAMLDSYLRLIVTPAPPPSPADDLPADYRPDEPLTAEGDDEPDPDPATIF